MEYSTFMTQDLPTAAAFSLVCGVIGGWLGLRKAGHSIHSALVPAALIFPIFLSLLFLVLFGDTVGNKHWFYYAARDGLATFVFNYLLVKDLATSRQQ